MIFRKLNNNDFEQYKILINNFRKTDFTYMQFQDILENEINIEIYVLEENNILIASGTILFEKKFIHNISTYSHIEDIIVKNTYQGKGIGKILMNNLINICKKRNSYKILLDCETSLIPFYEKCGFLNKGHQMVIYI